MRFTMQVPVDMWCYAHCEAATIEEAIAKFKERDFELGDIDSDDMQVTQDEGFYESIDIDDDLVWEDPEESPAPHWSSAYGAMGPGLDLVRCRRSGDE